MSIKRASIVMLAALAALGLVAAPRAGAIPQITDQTSPAPGETLAASPPQLILVFSEKLTTEPGVVLLDANGLTIPTQPAERLDDATQWIVAISSVLPPGTYEVRWSTPTGTGQYSFNVGQTATTASPTTSEAAGATPTLPGASETTDTTAVVGAAASPAKPSSGDGGSGIASVLAVIARWLSTLGLACVFGGLVVVALAWPEGVEYVITSRYLRTVWIVSLGATLLLMIATRAMEDGATLGSSIGPSALLELRDLPGGRALLLRFVFIAASGWVVLTPERVIDASTQIPAFAAPTLALLTYGFSRSDEVGSAALGAGAAIVHAVSFAVWIGGLALLARVVVIGPGDEDLLHAVRGFSRLAMPALIGVVVSGVIRTAQLSGGASMLLSTGYGRLLLVKAAGVAVLAYVGTVNRQTVRGRLGRASKLSGRAAGRLRRAFSAELLVGVVVMALGSWMLNASPPGVAEAAGASNVKAVAEVTMKDSGIDVTVGAAPAVVGVNTIVITIRKPVTGLVDMDVRLESPGGQGGGIDIPKVATVLDGKGSMRVEGVPLDTAGVWNVVVTAFDTDGALPIVNGVIEIAASADAAATPTVPGGSATTVAPVTTIAPGVVPPAAGSPNTATTTADL